MSIARLRGVQVSGWDLGAVITALELLTGSMKAQGVTSGPVFDVWRRMRAAYDEDCAAQSAQVAPEADLSVSVPTDFVTVKEVALIMGCSESNVRQRCKRGSLPAVSVGGQWRLSRAAVTEAVAP